MNRSLKFQIDVAKRIDVFWEGLQKLSLFPEYFSEPRRSWREKMVLGSRTVLPAIIVLFGVLLTTYKLLNMLHSHDIGDWMDAAIGSCASIVVVVSFALAILWQAHQISWWCAIYKTIGINNRNEVFRLQCGKGDIIHLVQDGVSLRIPGHPTIFRNSMLEPRVSSILKN